MCVLDNIKDYSRIRLLNDHAPVTIFYSCNVTVEIYVYAQIYRKKKNKPSLWLKLTIPIIMQTVYYGGGPNNGKRNVQ